MDAIKILIAFGFLLIPTILFRNKVWKWVWTSIALLIAIWELVWWLLYKRTISKEQWRWKEGQEWWKVLINAVGYAIFFGYLWTHLYLGW